MGKVWCLSVFCYGSVADPVAGTKLLCHSSPREKLSGEKRKAEGAG